jgi:hypothetical protein
MHHAQLEPERSMMRSGGNYNRNMNGTDYATRGDSPVEHVAAALVLVAASSCESLQGRRERKSPFVEQRGVLYYYDNFVKVGLSGGKELPIDIDLLGNACNIAKRRTVVVGKAHFGSFQNNRRGFCARTCCIWTPLHPR